MLHTCDFDSSSASLEKSPATEHRTCGNAAALLRRSNTAAHTSSSHFHARDRTDSDHDDVSDDSCDSCSDLTEKYYRREAAAGSGIPDPVKTFRPAVRFHVNAKRMDYSYTNSIKREISSDLSKLSRKGTGSVRYVQPRLSLLGKPVNFKMHRRDARYRRLQAKVYNFLERPKDWFAVSYHIGICAVCIGAIILSTLSTIDNFESTMTDVVIFMEPILLVWLTVEYVIRIWSSGCRSRYQGLNGRLKFAQRPLCIIDAVIIVSTVIVLLVGSSSETFAASTLRGIRFFQILRLVRMDRRAGTWKLLGSVVWAHRRELLTTVYIGFLCLLFFSYLVFLAEKEYNKHRFGTYSDALWWGVVTLCTVGYGDVVPSTWAGKLIASFSAVIGIAFFALPAGILGSGFALKVQEQQRQKHLIRRRVPAALLIQSLWRCYAADENSISIATWKPHMVPCPSWTQERPFKNNSSFVSRFSTRRKGGGTSSSNNSGAASPHSPLISRRDSKKAGSNSEDVPETLQNFVNRTWSHLSLATGLVDQRVDRFAMLRDNHHMSGPSRQEQSEEELELSPKVRELTVIDKRAIRSLRKIKYFVARKKFREALRPYDVKDVIEQYSAGHVDMLSRVKSLQTRLDQILGKTGSKSKDAYESKVSLSSRIVKVERQVEDIESKLDILIDMYKEDRKVLMQSRSTGKIINDTHAQTFVKPRSILIDKQYTSEPSSPIIEKIPRKMMLRNHSDLSSRIRKRVTYRLHSVPLTKPANSEQSDTQIHSAELECSSDVSNEDIAEEVPSDPMGEMLYETDRNMFDLHEEIANNNELNAREDVDVFYCSSEPPNNTHTSELFQTITDTISACDTHFCSQNEVTLAVTGSQISKNECKIDIDHSSDISNAVNCYPRAFPTLNETSDHKVLIPLGSVKALVADITDV